MKYVDDELAEAALLLAHAAEDARTPEGRMPPALEAKILAAGADSAQKNRYSTTKAGAVAIDASPEVVPIRRSSARAWSGWFAAAACVAVAVYAWRSTTLEREARDRAVATSRASQVVSTLALRDGAGVTVADVTVASDATGEITLRTAPAAGGAARYELWLSAGDREHARPAGKLTCETDCAGKSFHFVTQEGPVRAVWLVRSASGAGAALGRPLAMIPEDDVVATAGSATRRIP